MDDIELIKQKINLVDLIGEYLPLKKAGINFKANCPFHNEKSPSFIVSPERQIWKCFGCDKSGDLFTFLMEKEGVEFKEALEILAQKAGITLKKTNVKSDIKDKLLAINQKAAQYFNYLLTSHVLGKPALDYLHKRGLTDETIKLFQLGYAASSWDALTLFLKKRGFSINEIIDSGLAVTSARGGYDRFRGRIMFPLLDVRQQTLGFSGRIVKIGEPKYINTPQTLLFDKSKFLLGLNLTKGEIKEKKAAILVEGEMDMIMSFQTGIKNIVATKGTALTDQQLDLLKKYTDTLLLCFDTDLAGDAASRRGIELAEKKSFNLKVVRIPSGKDPADLCLKSPADWQQAVAEALPIYDYYLESVQKRFDLKSAFDKKAIFAEILPIWSKIPDTVLQEHYIQKLSALLQIKEELIRSELAKLKSAPPFLKPVTEVQTKLADNIELKSRRSLLENYLISLILHLPPDHIYVPNFPESLFTEPTLKDLYVLLVLYLDSVSFKGQAFKISEFIKTIPADLTPLVDTLYLSEIDDKLLEAKSWQKELNAVIMELKKMLIKSSLEKLSLQIKSAQSFGKIDTLGLLNKRFRDLSVKLKNL